MMGGLDVDLDEIVSEAATECETDLSASPDAQQGSRRSVNGVNIAPGGHGEGHDSAVRGADRASRPIVVKRSSRTPEIGSGDIMPVMRMLLLQYMSRRDEERAEQKERR